MKEEAFIAAQKGKQVKQAKPPAPQVPQPPVTLGDVIRQFETYLPLLEQLRINTGNWLIGSGSLSSGSLAVNDPRILDTSICVANFNASGSIVNLTTAHTHFLLTECVAGTATISSTDSSDNNLVSYIIIF